MRTGDVVIFQNRKSLYAKWFFGKIGFVEDYYYGFDGHAHCKVRWLTPVKYGSRGEYVKQSKFRANNFTDEWIDA